MNFSKFINIHFDRTSLSFECDKGDLVLQTLPNIKVLVDSQNKQYIVKQEEMQNQNLDLKAIKVIGHRGNGENSETNHFPYENTLESYELAIKKGADMIELDVHLTVDRKLVIFHDSRINGKWIYETTYDEFAELYENALKALNLKALTLDDVFEKLPQGFPIYVEIKYEETVSGLEHYPNSYIANLVEESIQMALKYPTRRMMFASFSFTVCALLKSRLANAHVLLLINEQIQTILKEKTCQYVSDFIDKFQLDGIVFDTKYKSNFEPILNHVKGSGKICMCYGEGTNNENEIRMLEEFGVNGFCTDDISLCIRTLNSIENEKSNI